MNKEIKKMLVMVLVGLVAIGMGIFSLVTDKNTDKKCTAETQATVVDYEEGEEYDSTSETYDTVYYPIVEYTVDGQTVVSRYSQCYSSQEYAVGEEITIQYDPTAPETFTVKGEHRGTFVAAWEIPVGVILIAIPIVKLVGYGILRKKSGM